MPIQPKAVHVPRNSLKEKKVLLVVENNSVPFDRRVWREAVALRDCGLLVRIICPKDRNESKSFESHRGIEIYRYPVRFSRGSLPGYFLEYTWSFFAITYLSMRIYFRRGGFDVIHIGNPPDIYWPLGVFLKILGVKYIFDEHDLWPEMFQAKFNGRSLAKKAIYLVLKTQEYLSIKIADAIIVTNESYRRLALKRGHIKQDKVYIVRNGPDTREFKVVEPVKKWKFGRPHMAAYLGIMASFDGVDYLIRAVQYIVNVLGRRDITFVLVGFGEKYASLVKMVDILDLDSFIKFTGRAERGKIMQILSTADVCVDPDPYNTYNNYSSMTKIMEYMACRSPIVAFRLKENVFSAQDAALFVRGYTPAALANGIIRLIDDKKLSRRMSRAGYKRLNDQLSWEKQQQNLINAYTSLFSSD